MKRLVMILLVLVLSLSLAGVAPAATPKIKSQECLDVATGFATVSMGIKAGVTIKKASGKVKFYAINGEFTNHLGGFSAPLVGTGHMTGTVFHFSATCTGLWPGTAFVITYSMEAEWDLANTAAQTIHFRILRDAGFGGDESFDQPFLVANCNTDNLAYLEPPSGDVDPATGLAR